VGHKRLSEASVAPSSLPSPDQADSLRLLEGIQPPSNAELRVNLLHVPLHRALGESEPLGNLLVLQSLRNELENITGPSTKVISGPRPVRRFIAIASFSIARATPLNPFSTTVASGSSSSLASGRHSYHEPKK
jgi:hypothetical protein